MRGSNALFVMGSLAVGWALLSASFLLVAAAGRDARVKRIIGGESVEIERVPYMLSLRLDGEHICGAVIIGHEWSLTAAHCCVAGNLTLRSGTASLGESGRSHRVTRATRHELYRQDDDDFDLCALRVEQAFEYSEVTAPALLPAPRQRRARASDAFVSGWGYTEADGSRLSPRLQLIRVSRLDLEDCKRAYRYLYSIHDDDACYGSGDGSQDACQGDSGGPLVDRHSVLLGIVSFGAECGYSKLPGVYVDVAQFREWIEQTTAL